MAKIRMKSTAAGPHGNFEAGKEYPENKITKQFVPEYAYYTENPEEKIKVNTAENEIKKSEVFPKATGGGWYKLSNGEKIQGKENAIEAEKKIDIKEAN